MNEPLFAPSAQSWTSLPPAFGWIQTGMGSRTGLFGNPGFAALQTVQQGQQGMTGVSTPVQTPQSMSSQTTQPYGFATGIEVSPQPGALLGASGAYAAPMLVTQAPYGVPSVVSAAMPQELPISLAAPTILAVVAMRRGQPMGPTNDQEIEEFIYDVLELSPGTSEVEVRCEGGRVTLTGSVNHRRMKHDVGEIVWAIPQITDVQNNVTIATRRRSRSAPREAEAAIAPPGGRKQA